MGERLWVGLVMLTGMMEKDWDIVGEVFRAVRSKRGEPGHDGPVLKVQLARFAHSEYFRKRPTPPVFRFLSFAPLPVRESGFCQSCVRSLRALMDRRFRVRAYHA